MFLPCQFSVRQKKLNPSNASFQTDAIVLNDGSEIDPLGRASKLVRNAVALRYRSEEKVVASQV